MAGFKLHVRVLLHQEVTQDYVQPSQSICTCALLFAVLDGCEPALWSDLRSCQHYAHVLCY